MATAKRLPSGSYRVKVFAGYVYVDGVKKKKYESFTAPTKAEAEMMASAWNNSRKQRPADVTVHDAIERYITAKTNVLSPSTIRGYRQMQKAYYDSIETLRVGKLTTENLQLFVSEVASDVSAKTTKNVYGLLISAVKMFRPDAVFNVSMPRAVKHKKTAPTNEDVKVLFASANGDMKICIALAAFGSLRRGEVCALKHSDVVGNVISVHADMVEDEKNKFHYKEMPKTADSVRKVSIPAEVVDLIGDGDPDSFIINRTPNAVTHAFTRLRNSLGINIRFHDLRHYYAAIGAVLGIPDNYLSSFGGWKQGSSVMKEIYQNIMSDASTEYSNLMTSHFSDMITGKKVISMPRNVPRKKKKA